MFIVCHTTLNKVYLILSYLILSYLILCDIWSMNTWPTYPAINQQIFCQNWGIWFSKIHCDVKTWTHCQHYWSFVWESPGDRWIPGTAVSLLEASFALWVLSLPVSVFTAWKINHLNPIWIRLLGQSQLSNPSDLPCYVCVHQSWAYLCNNSPV